MKHLLVGGGGGVGINHEGTCHEGTCILRK